jgi:hypothetical protein
MGDDVTEAVVTFADVGAKGPALAQLPRQSVKHVR